MSSSPQLGTCARSLNYLTTPCCQLNHFQLCCVFCHFDGSFCLPCQCTADCPNSVGPNTTSTPQGLVAPACTTCNRIRLAQQPEQWSHYHSLLPQPPRSMDTDAAARRDASGTSHATTRAGRTASAHAHSITNASGSDGIVAMMLEVEEESDGMGFRLWGLMQPGQRSLCIRVTGYEPCFYLPAPLVAAQEGGAREASAAEIAELQRLLNLR